MRCNPALPSAALAVLLILNGVVLTADRAVAGSRTPARWLPPTLGVEVEAGSTPWQEPLAVVLPARPVAPPVSRETAYSEELPVCVGQVTPEYPTLAREAEISGRVVTHLLVGADGRVHDVRVDPQHSVRMLEDAATAAAREFTFIPALVNDRPVPVWVAVPFSFRLY